MLASKLNKILRQYYYTQDELITAMDSISFYDINNYKRIIFQKAYLKCLFVGNILTSSALDIVSSI